MDVSEQRNGLVAFELENCPKFIAAFYYYLQHNSTESRDLEYWYSFWKKSNTGYPKIEWITIAFNGFLLPETLSSNSKLSIDLNIEQFEREAQIASKGTGYLAQDIDIVNWYKAINSVQ